MAPSCRRRACSALGEGPRGFSLEASLTTEASPSSRRTSSKGFPGAYTGTEAKRGGRLGRAGLAASGGRIGAQRLHLGHLPGKVREQAADLGLVLVSAEIDQNRIVP